MVEYTGQYTCLSWRSISKVDSYYDEAKINPQCMSKCYRNDARPVYNVEEYCDQQAVCTITSYSLNTVTTPGLPPSNSCRQMTCLLYTSDAADE